MILGNILFEIVQKETEYVYKDESEDEEINYPSYLHDSLLKSGFTKTDKFCSYLHACFFLALDYYQKAKKMITKDTENVADIYYAVRFSSPKE
jgi:hypothetical protein